MSCCPARTAANAQFYCPCVLSIVALILLPLGISMIADAGLANVETDFIALGKVCNVTAIHHRSDTITSTNFAGQGATRRKYYTHACWDYYNYTFVAPPFSSTATYVSRPEAIKRTVNLRCSEAPIVKRNTSFQLGKLYHCWAPADGKSKANLPESYKCGNSACVKLFNPEQEIINVYSGANGLLLGGGICAMIAFAFCSYSAALRKKQIALHAQEAQRAAVVVSGVPVSSSSPSDFVAQGHAVVDVDRRL